MDFLKLFILIIFLIIMGIAYKNEFYSNYFNEKFSNENNIYQEIYPYGPSPYYFNNWGWIPYKGLYPYYNPWWYYPYPYPLPINYN